MDVDHGGRWAPQNLERGIVPLDFVMLQNFKHHYLHYNVGKCFSPLQQDFYSKLT